jgi:putative nucleotidyltransferase with HDIG domain
MLTSGDVIGVIQVQSHRLAAYSQEAVDLLSGMANVAAIAIENARLIQKIREALDSTVRIVGDTVEIRDPYTAGHQRRVTKLACVIAKKLGLPEGKIDGVRVASLLHDIGKMSIPAEILSKPTRLTEIEFALVRQHPQVAHDLLKYISFPWPIAEIVLQHHERMDGSGYPLGLEGKEILPEACILAVSDVVEAMSSHRPYRAALGVSAALEEIKKNRGRLYSEVVVDACVRLFADGEISLEQERWIGDPAYRSGV